MERLQLNKGFTLIEVLVALMILAIAFVAVIKALQDSISDTSRVQSYLIAHWVGMDVLARVQVGLLPTPEAGTPLKGKMTMLDQPMDWQAQLIAGTASASAGFARMAINVKAPNTKRRLEHLEAFVRLNQQADQSSE